MSSDEAAVSTSSGGEGDDVTQTVDTEKTFLIPAAHKEESNVTSSSGSTEELAAPEKKNSVESSSGDFSFLSPSAPHKASSSSLESSSSSPSSTQISSTLTQDERSSSSQRQERKERRKEEKQEKYQQILSTLNYHPPKYAAPCADTRYNFEVLKNGTIVDSVKFSSFDRSGYYIVGRVPGCDIVAENPTVSRMHAILQFIQCPKGESTSSKGEDPTDFPEETGLYLYDLNSTHGTFLNKNQLFPQKFYRVHVGHVLKFGSSQRMYIVNGPDEDEEEESDKSVTELLNERLQKDLERKRLEEEQQLKRERAASHSKLPKENIEEEGINWGMAEDADEESDLRVNPFAIDFEASDLNLDNPKKSLRSWFEREGQDLEFEIREKGNGQYICRIALPLDGPTDGPVYAESEVKGKKKEAVNDAAMKACQILDSHGLLRASNQETRKRKEKKWEDEDYYSSDEDTYLDRTGSVEKKRQKRMRLAGKTDSGEPDGNVLTYDSLCSKYAELEKQIVDLKESIAKSEQIKERADDGDVDIDDYMNLLKSGVFDVKKLKAQLKIAQAEIGRTKKLMEIAKPADLPSYLQMKPTLPANVTSTATEKKDSQNEVEVDAPSDATESASLSPPKAQHTSPIKPMVGPRKPSSLNTSSSSSTPPAQPKRFGLITPADFVALKSASLRPPPGTVTKNLPSEDHDDAPFEEEEDSSSSEGDADDATPSTTVNEGAENETDPTSVPEFTKPTKKKRQRYRNKNKSRIETGVGGPKRYEDDPNYSEWVPPTGQTGDGRTSLNEKLGY